MHFLAIAGIHHHFLAPDAVVFFHEFTFVDQTLFEESGVARVEDGDFAHHLTHNHFKVLIVDAHTLRAVHILHLIHDVFLHGSWSHDTENVGRGGSAIGERCACAHEVVLLHKDLLRQRHEILLFFSQTAGNLDFAVTTLDSA